MPGRHIGFLIHNEDNLIGASELQQNKTFLNSYLLATSGLDLRSINIQALVKDFAAQSGQYSELQMHNIVGGCFLLHHYLPRVKELALELNHINYAKLRTLWKSLIAVSLETPQALWDLIDSAIVEALTASRPNQALPTCRQLAALIRDELIRLGVYEEPEEEEETPEAAAAKLESMLGAQLLESPHPGVTVLNVTLPSDNAHEIKQRLEAEAQKLSLREDQVLTDFVCGSAEERDAHCDIRIFGYGELTDAVEVTPVSLHGVGRLTGAQQSRMKERSYCYENIFDIAAILRDIHDPTPAQRMLVMLRDGTCRFPGCNVDARFCETDHVINYEVGGWTSIGNLQCLCHHHHNFKTDRHARAVSDTFGNITWTFATGVTVTTVPNGVLAGKFEANAAGITTRHDHPTKTDEDYLQPPIRDGFGRWGTTLINYRAKQRKRYIERNRLKATVPNELPLQPPPPPVGFEPPPDDAWPEPPEDYRPLSPKRKAPRSTRRSQLRRERAAQRPPLHGRTLEALGRRLARTRQSRKSS